MIIKVKLTGMLKDRTPPGGQLHLSDSASVGDALVTLEIEPQAVQAFSVNGSILRDTHHPLQNDDELMILAPVGGG